MTEILHKAKIPPHLIVWIIGFVAIALIGGSLAMDLSGMSSADQFVLVNWGVAGLRIYLWLEGITLSALVTAFGASVISTGLAVARGEASRMFGNTIRLHPSVPRQMGYVFVLLGASLVALSLRASFCAVGCEESLKPRALEGAIPGCELFTEDYLLRAVGGAASGFER
jgi:hypothetical protein